jgi:hypothetical protein
MGSNNIQNRGATDVFMKIHMDIAALSSLQNMLLFCQKLRLELPMIIGGEQHD